MKGKREPKSSRPKLSRRSKKQLVGGRNG